ncbi:hypothetical protein [Rhizobium mongolense]|uniref:hypothetical protein n=1 Tax=Rhizobium mongolense TaxID=57676 RepID=UPI001113F06F|nr:hypothetical protein [Rhizobium mongolense]
MFKKVRNRRMAGDAARLIRPAFGNAFGTERQSLSSHNRKIQFDRRMAAMRRDVMLYGGVPVAIDREIFSLNRSVRQKTTHCAIVWLTKRAPLASSPSEEKSWSVSEATRGERRKERTTER